MFLHYQVDAAKKHDKSKSTKNFYLFENVRYFEQKKTGRVLPKINRPALLKDAV
jgi:hypothetical protein